MSDPFEAGRQSTRGRQFESAESKQATAEYQSQAFASLLSDLDARLSEYGIAVLDGAKHTLSLADHPEQPPYQAHYCLIAGYLLIYLAPGEPGYRVVTSTQSSKFGNSFDMAEVYPPEELEGLHSRDQVLEFCGRLVEPYTRHQAEADAEMKEITAEHARRHNEIMRESRVHTVKEIVGAIVQLAIFAGIAYAAYYFLYVQNIAGIF